MQRMKSPKIHTTFDEKVRIFSCEYLKCCIYISNSDSFECPFTKDLFARLVSTSVMLEDFLDFHGAKNNKDWYFYRELASAVRHLSLAGFSQIHILNRLIFYDLQDTEVLRKEGRATLYFLKNSLIKLASVIIDEAKYLNIPIPTEKYDISSFPSITSSEILEYNIDGEEDTTELQKKSIVRIASQFLSIAANFDSLAFYKPYDIEGILAIVPEKVNEVEIRRFEMLVHNLQSSFDTNVIHGDYRFGDRELKQFRGVLSVIFYLLKMTGRLLHFYERHLHINSYKNTYQKAKECLEHILDYEVMLDRTINYGLFSVCRSFSKGEKLAKEILNKNVERSYITVGIPLKMGFHSRPSLLVAKVVEHYGGQVELRVKDDRFDAGSVLDIQWAGGKIQKEKIKEVVFQGDSRALKDIKILAGVNYGEDMMGKGGSLPMELKYLR